MRKFFITDKRGKFVPLQGGEYFFTNAVGLGYEREAEYISAASGFHSRQQSGFKQRIITGKLVVSGDAYAEYERLARLIGVQEGATLAYMPREGKTLFLDVDLIGVELSGEAKFGVLEIALTMAAKGPFYLRSDKSYTLKSGVQAESVMRFGFAYPFYFTNNASEARHVVCAGGDFPAALEAVISGPLSAPVLMARRTDTGEIIGRLDLGTVSIGMEESIRFLSHPGAESVVKRGIGGEKNLIDELDLANENFFRIPVGVPVELSISADIPDGVDVVIHSISLREYVVA